MFRILPVVRDKSLSVTHAKPHKSKRRISGGRQLRSTGRLSPFQPQHFSLRLSDSGGSHVSLTLTTEHLLLPPITTCISARAISGGIVPSAAYGPNRIVNFGSDGKFADELSRSRLMTIHSIT